MVEHTAVNRGVTGSSPVWGALKICLIFFMKMRPMASTSSPFGVNWFFLCLKAQTIPSQKDLPFEKDPYIIRSILLLDSTLFLH